MKSHGALPQAFADLGVDVRILKALQKMQFSEPSEIQRAMIGPALAGRDILGQARTGTGKTAAFGIPILQNLDENEPELQAICLAPTRELAVQVAAEIRRLAEFTSIKCVPVYGGQKVATQLHLLGRRHQFVVGTPGRVIDLLNRRSLKLDKLKIAVLDEVDRMLDIGFRDDIKKILSQIRQTHQTIFVSATLDDEINRLARQFMVDPLEVNVSRDSVTVEEVEQFYVSVDPHHKYKLLRHLLREQDPKLAIVFCNTKHGVRKLVKKLHSDNLEAKEIHGDLIQSHREKVMDRFRRHKLRILVATDLASRGIDVTHVTHIINYDIPKDPHVYIHRIGRTARMGASGKAYTLVSGDEGKQLTEVEKLINKELIQLKFDEVAPPPPPKEEPEAQPDVGYGRMNESVFGDSGSQTAALPRPKTLGAKFKPRRKRRL